MYNNSRRFKTVDNICHRYGYYGGMLYLFVYLALQWWLVGKPVVYTLKQRVFITKIYWITNSIAASQRAIRIEFLRFEGSAQQDNTPFSRKV